MTRNRIRRRNGRSIPQVFNVENLAPVTADTQVSQTLYNPPDTTTSLGTPTIFRFGRTELTVIAGAATARVFVVVRRVPEGYSFPAMTIASGVSSLTDPSNVIAYGYIQSTNTMPTYLTSLNTVLKLQPGDTIGVQAVSDTTSAGQRVDLLGSFHLSAA